MPADPSRVESVFHAALNLLPADRAAFLAVAVGGAAELRARVERLLAAHAELESPPPTADHAPQPDAGTMVAGRYKFLEEIGEGGMGTVWMAQQTEPVKRLVAVKLIKAGMDSRAVLARFEAERQALALMDHPNIAKVFDAGATPDGRPFFVMELVKGVPITKYCDDHKLTPRQRLELFVQVCQAIQHAHQKGVIHRDIKPSNVLVALYDDRPVPKIIDFGVAKAAGQALTEKTLATGFGAVVGTPEYMSPEQASFNNLDIDTRSDVYALGALLYELLAGSPPFSREELEKVGLLEIFRVIREQDPPRPSAKLSTASALPTLSANRGTEPAKLTRLLRGELDWIVMKALEKDRNRRYETAGAFARDLQRYLADEVVEAQPPSVRYRVTKFARRNARLLSTAAAFVLLVVAGAGVSVWQAVEARRAEVNARQAEAESRAVLDFFKDKVLSAARPRGVEGGQGSDISLRAALDAAEPEIAAAFAGHPRAEAEIRNTLGLNYSWLEEHERAIRQFELVLSLDRQAFGPDHLYTLNTMSNLAQELQQAGRVKEARPLAEEALDRARHTLAPDDVTLLHAAAVLASIYRAERRFSEALALVEEELRGRKARGGPDDPQTLLALNHLGVLSGDAGRWADAARLQGAALAGMRARRGPSHPSTLLFMFNLATAYRHMGRIAEALPLFDESQRVTELVFGPDRPVTLSRLQVTIQAHEQARDWAGAAVWRAKQLESLRRRLPPGHTDLAGPLGHLGLCRLQAGDPAAAEAPFRECVSIQERMFPDNWRRFYAMAYLGESLFGQKKYEEAEPYLVKGYEGMKSREKEIDPANRDRLPVVADRLVELFLATGKPEEVAKWRAERAKYPFVAPPPREVKR